MKFAAGIALALATANNLGLAYLWCFTDTTFGGYLGMAGIFFGTALAFLSGVVVALE